MHCSSILALDCMLFVLRLISAYFIYGRHGICLCQKFYYLYKKLFFLFNGYTSTYFKTEKPFTARSVPPRLTLVSGCIQKYTIYFTNIKFMREGYMG